MATLTDAFRSTVLDLPIEVGSGVSGDPLRLSREDDLVEFFQSSVRALLRGRDALPSKGSELDRRNDVEGGVFVSLLLMPGYATVTLGVVTTSSSLCSLHVRTGCPPIP